MRSWVCHVLLIAVALRALIPTGYMPDFRSAQGGVLSMVICSATGNKIVDVDGQGTPIKHGGQHHGSQACAFSGLAHLALGSLQLLPGPTPEFVTAANLTADDSWHPPVRAGPPVGSQAPPLHS